MANPSEGGGLAALQRLTTTKPPQWLSPSPELSHLSRSSSKYLFSSLHPFCPKSPFDSLLVEGFDAEQIWQQIDLETKPLISNLQRQVKNFEKNPDEILSQFGGEIAKKDEGLVKENGGYYDDDDVDDDDVEVDMEDDEESDDEEEDDEAKVKDDEMEEEEQEEEEQEEEEEEDSDSGDSDRGIEDKFLKVKELRRYVEDDEAREFGGREEKRKKRKPSKVGDGSDEEEDEDEDDDEEDESDDDELGDFGIGSDEDDKLGTARYDDFFGGKKKEAPKRKPKSLNGLEYSGADDEQEDEEEEEEDEEDEQDDEEEDEQDDQEEDEQKDDNNLSVEKQETLSTHEIQAQKLRTKIEQMEKANLEPKEWNMQGEISALRRSKDSALEVDLDFEHNVRPAPVITEEITASIEELIKKRIVEGNFDNVRRRPSNVSKAPKEIKELDENKSKKGLAELYEYEYSQKTDPASAPLSFSEEQTKEAMFLFKTVCSKLDALSHFHFTPKPIIEDMSIQTNVPAIAMEEIAPVAVSDAAMLAPEEVFSGKGDIKEDAELTQEDRKRRRATKKRKYKAETTRRMEKKARNNQLPDHSKETAAKEA